MVSEVYLVLVCAVVHDGGHSDVKSAVETLYGAGKVAAGFERGQSDANLDTSTLGSRSSDNISTWCDPPLACCINPPHSECVPHELVV